MSRLSCATRVSRSAVGGSGTAPPIFLSAPLRSKAACFKQRREETEEGLMLRAGIDASRLCTEAHRAPRAKTRPGLGRQKRQKGARHGAAGGGRRERQHRWTERNQ